MPLLSTSLCEGQFVYVDADKVSEVALDRYKVIALPTFKVFKWGEEVESVTGLEGDKLKERLRKLCAGTYRTAKIWSPGLSLTLIRLCLPTDHTPAIGPMETKKGQ